MASFTYFLVASVILAISITVGTASAWGLGKNDGDHNSPAYSAANAFLYISIAFATASLIAIIVFYRGAMVASGPSAATAPRLV